MQNLIKETVPCISYSTIEKLFSNIINILVHKKYIVNKKYAFSERFYEFKDYYVRVQWLKAQGAQKVLLHVVYFACLVLLK